LRPFNLLLLCDVQPGGIAATVHDHIVALERYSRHRYYRLSMFGDIPASLDLDRFDGIVVHYTLILCSDSFMSRESRARLARFRGLKAMFIQDEYRFVDATIAAMREVGINLLFTCVPAPEVDKVYSSKALPDVTKVSVHTGYVPEGLAELPVKPPSARAIDIGYRGRNLPAWLGKLGREKLQIGIRVAEDAPRYGLKTDISFREEDRLYGKRWIDFVSQCKAMLGVESGASVFDFTGDIQRNVERHVALHPGATFEELHDRYFANEEGKINLAQISPRCFESAALRTLMVLYEGEYSGILKPWQHYVPLKKDHSNMAEVVAVLRDANRMEEIAQRAHREIALNPKYSFAHSISEADAAIEMVMTAEMLSKKPAYERAEYRKAIAVNFRIRANRMKRRAELATRDVIYGSIFRVLLRSANPAQRDRIHERLRPIILFIRRGASLPWRISRRLWFIGWAVLRRAGFVRAKRL
jgi:hypothetical protein